MTPEGFKQSWMAGKRILVDTAKEMSSNGYGTNLMTKYLENEGFLEAVKAQWLAICARHELQETEPWILVMTILSQVPDINTNIVNIVDYISKHEGTNINPDIRKNAQKVIGMLRYIQNRGGNAATKEKNRQQFDTWRMTCTT